MAETTEMLLPGADGPIPTLESSTIEISQSKNVEDTNHIQATRNLYPSDPNLTVLPDNTVRARLRRILGTHRFQVFVVSFVIVDCMVVIAELLMDLRILSLLEDMGTNKKNGEKPEAHYLVPDVLHSISIAILAMFLLETVIKIAAYGLHFLRMGWEIFDGVVVIVTFVLDVLMQHSHSSTNGLGLLIIMRLWRVARILNGMVRSVQSRAVRHVECEKRRREALEEQLLKYRQLCHNQKQIIDELESILKSHNIPLPADIANIHYPHL